MKRHRAANSVSQSTLETRSAPADDVLARSSGSSTKRPIVSANTDGKGSESKQFSSWRRNHVVAGLTFVTTAIPEARYSNGWYEGCLENMQHTPMSEAV